jgi:hypothetical protein
MFSNISKRSFGVSEPCINRKDKYEKWVGSIGMFVGFSGSVPNDRVTLGYYTIGFEF